jgi:hypothetical protein
MTLSRETHENGVLLVILKHEIPKVQFKRLSEIRVVPVKTTHKLRTEGVP